MMMKIGLLVCGFLALAAAGDSACPSFWTQHLESCWHFYSAPVTWNEAQMHCRFEGAELVYILNHDDNSFIKSLARRQKIWIGLMSLNNWHRTKWLHERLPVKYTNWAPGQPRDARAHSERCALIDNAKDSGLWHSYPCSRHYPFICRKPLEVLTAGPDGGDRLPCGRLS